MLRTSIAPWVATHLPALFSGTQLHHAALIAFHRADYTVCDQLLERAAERYREDLAMEALARLRTHQMILHVHAGRLRDTQATLEVDRRLSRLERIETLCPPFASVPAHQLIGHWRDGSNAAGVGVERGLPRAA
jgi:hypothetical protein